VAEELKTPDSDGWDAVFDETGDHVSNIILESSVRIEGLFKRGHNYHAGCYFQALATHLIGSVYHIMTDQAKDPDGAREFITNIVNIMSVKYAEDIKQAKKMGHIIDG
jgi:hypothetical protein